MKNGLFKILLLVFMATILGCASDPPPEPSCNFVMNQNNRRVSWARLPIVFFVDESVNAEQYRVISESMAVWNDVFDRPVFQLANRDQLTFDIPEPSVDANGKVISDGYNGIYSVSKDVFQNTTSKDEQGRTSISFRGDFIYEADILIDSSETFYYQDREVQSSQQAVNFKSLMVHELGHALGLEHIEEVNNSVMNPSLGYGEFRVNITDADYDSLACEYQ